MEHLPNPSSVPDLNPELEGPNKTKTLQESHIQPNTEIPKVTNQVALLAMLNEEKESLQAEVDALKSIYKRSMRSCIDLSRNKFRFNVRSCVVLQLKVYQAVTKCRDEENKEDIKEEEEGIEEEGQIDRKGKRVVMIDGTSEKSDGKLLMGSTDNGADKVLDKMPPRPPIKLVLKRSCKAESHKLGGFLHNGSQSVARGGSTSSESTSGESTCQSDTALRSKNDEGSQAPGLVEIRETLSKTDLRSNRIKIGSTKEMDVDISRISEKKKKVSAKTNHEAWYQNWASKDEMLLYLKFEPELQLEAVCTLYRHERMAREQMPYRLTDSNFKKITRIVAFLTDGDMYGPCKRSVGELEAAFTGSRAFCSWLIGIYSSILFHIYSGTQNLSFTRIA